MSVPDTATGGRAASGTSHPRTSAHPRAPARPRPWYAAGVHGEPPAPLGPITAALTARPDPAPHRKRVRHYEVFGQARMFTFSCYQRRPLLMDERARRLLAHALTRPLSQSPRQGWTLMGFVFMPEHVHLVLLPRSRECNAPALLSAVKRPMSYRYKQLLIAAGDPRLEELTVRERPGKTAFRFWQEGPGHDANLDGDDGIRRALAYVHHNPVKRGLCTGPGDWAWSSARQYLGLAPLSPWVPRVVRMTHRGAMWEEDGAR